MRRFMLPFVVFASLSLLGACGNNTEDNNVTETRMDDLDSIEGTISDDIIDTDQSTDEPLFEAAPPADGSKSKANPVKAEETADDRPEASKKDDKAAAE